VRRLAGVLAAAGLWGCGGYGYGDSRPVLTVADVVAMKQAGVADEVIAAKISTSRVPEPLTATEIVRLKDQGINEALLERLVEASAPPPVVYRNVYYPAPYGPSPYWYGYGPRFHVGYHRWGYHPYYGHRRWAYRHRPRTYRAR